MAASGGTRAILAALVANTGTVPYKHLTLPTKTKVENPVAAVSS